MYIDMPEGLTANPQWLVANADKIPVLPCSGTYLTGDRNNYTMEFQSALDLVVQARHKYLVFCHSIHDPIISLDIDHCIHHATATTEPWISAFMADNRRYLGYFELSSSNTGLRIPCLSLTKDFNRRIYYPDPVNYKRPQQKNTPKVEVIANRTLATYTGNVHPHCQRPSLLTPVTPILKWLDDHWPIPEKSVNAPNPSFTRSPGKTEPQDIHDAMRYLSPDLPHREWKEIGMALHDWDSHSGFDIWKDWSKGGEKFRNEKDLLYAWRSFKPESGITLGTLFHYAKQAGYRQRRELTLLPAAERRPDPDPEPDDEDPDIQPPIPILTGSQLMNMPPIRFLVDGLLPETGLVQIFGESGSYKSFVALDLAMAVVSGTPWFGKPVRQGSVLYLCGEGSAGMGARLQGWMTKQIQCDIDNLLMSTLIPPINNQHLCSQLVRWMAVRTIPVKLIIVDTFARAMAPLGSESDNGDIGSYIALIEKLQHLTGALVVQIHHCGHGNKSRSRGGSALYAALDAEYQITTMGARNGWLKCTKAKDFDPVDDHLFAMLPVRISDTRRSLVMQYKATPTTEDIKQVKKMTPRQERITGIYGRLLKIHQANAEGHPRVKPMVLAKDLKTELIREGITDKYHASQELDRLCKAGILVLNGLYVSLSTQP